ncbi:Uu.00g093920.m01.CDS01 [Anthostomella pinea]|uniref:Uu.00g093920.m01.CDS01 n=1 Tax=Anthostomella pinea TaxID=933095 RepID=A0AAI8YKH5_9PEZI|nr:Uu.00g093920.m01.CDS01 [Anthostomella pinea]
MEVKTGLILGYNGVHPFSKVNITDRASVQELLRTLLDPLEPFFSPLKARVKCPGATAVRFDQTASEVEGICRPLWGLACLLAGGGDYNGTEWWIQGIKAGTDPESPEYWGYPRDNDQRMVEMCPLGYALAVAPVIWQSLNEKERGNVENWLGNSINEKNMPNTNWLWFRVFANLGLKKQGGKFSQERLDRDIEHLNTFYRGDGWSNDGPEGIHQMDYYSSSFAIQFLQLLYAKLAGEDEPERAAEFKKRAQVVALDLIHYYDNEGRSIPFGRSVGYRFAMVSFWGAMAYAGVELPEPLTWGMVKGVVLRHLRWWQTQPDIWSPSGTLTIGYTFPNMYLAENYNSPGSPYWACLAFICLAVPADHPFWTSEEQPLGDALPKIKELKQPGHIMSYLGGHCMLLSSGQACSYPMKGTHAKYGSFAYSSAYGYSVPPGLFTLEQYALASQLGLSDDGGEFWKARRVSEYAGLEHRPHDDDPNGKGKGKSTTPVLVSVWKPFPDVTVRTTLVPPAEETPNWHLRAHRIDAAGRAVMTADGAFAISNERRADGRYLDAWDATKCEGTSPRIIGNYDLATPEGWAGGRQGAFAVSKGAVGIRALEDIEGKKKVGRSAMLVNADPNSNIVESRTLIPTLQHTVGKGEVVWYVSAIYAKPSGEGVAPESYLDGWEKVPEIPAWLRAEMEE